MNSTTLSNITTAINQSLQNQTQIEMDGITTQIINVILKIFEVLTNTNQEYGFWKFLIVLFAIIGFFAVLSAILGKLLDGFGVIFKIFIVLPAIIIIGFLNKKKRKKRLTAWGELKKDLKKSNKKISKKMWAYWIFSRIIAPLLILILIILNFT